MDQYKMIDMLILGWCSVNALQFFYEVPHKNISNPAILIKILLDFFSPYINSNLGKMWEEVIITFLKVVIKKKQERNTVLVQVMKTSGVCLSLKFSARQELVVSFKS